MTIGLFPLTSCNSFDKEIALNEFKELNPACEILTMVDYECEGTFGECWYVNFKYTRNNSEIVYDTTLQYWKRENKWMTRREFDKFRE
jgi:hypothetical protein